MTLVIPLGFAECAAELRGAGDPQPWFVTFGVDLGEGTETDEDKIDQVSTLFGTTIMGVVDNTVRFKGIHARVGTGTTDTAAIVTSADVPGAGGFPSLPQNCAALIDKFTGAPGRTGRGRFFMPMVLAESQVDNVGVITGTVVTQITTAFQHFRDLLAVNDGFPIAPMVLLHNAGSVLPTPAPFPVLSCQCQSTISTQRRRLR
jgi:hypothetical protein